MGRLFGLVMLLAIAGTECEPSVLIRTDMVISASAATLGVAAAAATYVPARRATHGDPIAALRAE